MHIVLSLAALLQHNIFRLSAQVSVTAQRNGEWQAGLYKCSRMRWDVVPFWQNACATSAGEVADMSHFECHTLMAKIIPPTLHKWETSTGRSRLDSEFQGKCFPLENSFIVLNIGGHSNATSFKCNLHPDLTTSICCFSRPAAGLPLDLCTGWPQFPYAGLNSLSQIHTILCTKGIIQLYTLPH